MKISSLTLAAAGAIIASGCHAAKQGTGSTGSPAESVSPSLVLSPQTVPAGSVRQAPAVIPKAVAYRMSGPYADNVPVNVDAAGEIVSYPAPSDLGPDSAPVDLGDGWWLDRRGVSTGSVFTRYTYGEYRSLAAPPSLAELKSAIIPGARVTEAVALPMTLPEAEADQQAAKNALPVYRLSR